MLIRVTLEEAQCDVCTQAPRQQPAQVQVVDEHAAQRGEEALLLQRVALTQLARDDVLQEGVAQELKALEGRVLVPAAALGQQVGTPSEFCARRQQRLLNELRVALARRLRPSLPLTLTHRVLELLGNTDPLTAARWLCARLRVNEDVEEGLGSVEPAAEAPRAVRVILELREAHDAEERLDNVRLYLARDQRLAQVGQPLLLLKRCKESQLAQPERHRTLVEVAVAEDQLRLLV